MTADTVIIATGAVAKRMDFPGSHDGEGGYWNKVRGSITPPWLCIHILQVAVICVGGVV